VLFWLRRTPPNLKERPSKKGDILLLLYYLRPAGWRFTLLCSSAQSPKENTSCFLLALSLRRTCFASQNNLPSLYRQDSGYAFSGSHEKKMLARFLFFARLHRTCDYDILLAQNLCHRTEPQGVTI